MNESSGADATVTLPPPRSNFVVANRLRHHLLEWGTSGPVVLMVHGFLEHAHTWHLAAPTLAAAGYHVYALDWRGHGDSEWIGPGGYYHFPDYTADLTFIVPQLGERVALVAHSMGGGVAVMYAGSVPERVSALVSVEGLGLPDTDPDTAADRVRAWTSDLARVTQRTPRRVTLEEAAQRLERGFMHFSKAAARYMAEQGTRPNGDARVWKFDPMHQTQSPQPYYVAQARSFWRRVTCPVLYIDGSDTPLRLPEPELAERLALLHAERVTIAKAGHHPHLEQPGIFTQAVLDFFARRLNR